MRMGCEVYHALKGLIKAKYGEQHYGRGQNTWETRGRVGSIRSIRSRLA